MDGKIIKVFDWYAKGLKEKHSLSQNQYQALHRKTWLCGIDYGTGDLPHYALADSENRIDLVLFFKQLKKNGYILRNLVSDGNQEILRAAKFVYGDDLIFQLCIKHFLEGLKGLMIQHEAENNVSRTQELINEIRKIIKAESLQEAKELLDILKRKSNRYRSNIQKQIKFQFKEKINDLIAYLRYPEREIPRTNNDIENIFRQVSLNIKSIGRFMNFWNAHNYLNAWALMRRFTKFTDCKKGRKHRNGKAPLEIAGCDINKLDYLNLFKNQQ